MSKDILRYDPDKCRSDMVGHDGVLCLAGQAGEDTKAGIKSQTESILRQIDVLLARSGSNKSKLPSAVVYVSDRRLKSKMDEVWTAWIDAKAPPARATVEARLGSPETLVEILCVAAKCIPKSP